MPFSPLVVNRVSLLRLFVLFSGLPFVELSRFLFHPRQKGFPLLKPFCFFARGILGRLLPVVERMISPFPPGPLFFTPVHHPFRAIRSARLPTRVPYFFEYSRAFPSAPPLEGFFSEPFLSLGRQQLEEIARGWPVNHNSFSSFYWMLDLPLGDPPSLPKIKDCPSGVSSTSPLLVGPSPPRAFPSS